MQHRMRIFKTSLFCLCMTLATPAMADEEAANLPRVYTDEWGGCYVKTVPDDYTSLKGTTRVYNVQKEADELTAEYDWYAKKVDLICNACHDGTCGPLVVRHGPWSRGHEPSDADLALAFYHGDKLMKRYSTLDIEGDAQSASRSVSHYTVIREHKGFVYTRTGQPRYVVITHDGRELTFNAITGAQITLQQNTDAEKALLKAAKEGDRAGIARALERGADINTSVADEYAQDYSHTPLHLAYRSGGIELVEFLLENGADISARTHRGETVLSLAVQTTNAQNVEILLENGADPDTVAPFAGEHMLHRTVNTYKGLTVAKVLLAHGADITATDDYGRMPVHAAAFSYQGTDILALLIDQGADVNAVSNFGETPLHLAARYGQAAHVKMLLEHGAKPGIKDNEGKTPMDHASARTNGGEEIVKVLKKASAE